MSDTIEVRDHSKPCKHEQVVSHWLDRHLITELWCPGGRKVVLREEFIPMNASFPINRLVYVEAEDE